MQVALVVRRDDDGLRRYVHLGTGNYNPSTAPLYTDLGLFTANPELGEDIDEFLQLPDRLRPSQGVPKAHGRPLHHNEGTSASRATVEAHAAKKPARIRMKMNSLSTRASSERSIARRRPA